ncbi:hypothetical protein OTSGILL_0746 [Orientia tsutsugamushi str. Gilliam]|uniref:Uncharacterized protein n=1 Tax=Orientia tsutsugamushi str. Gilliam TaxID=1359184 RepID=A0A0F3MCU2_ORITS|nr:hypothetical protein OTSGILL_0746 [Orientia tsutsugamushi str. Gilliam]
MLHNCELIPSIDVPNKIAISCRLNKANVDNLSTFNINRKKETIEVPK